ncbi:MAG: Fe(3+) ABC transporter substrate-binding protein [Calditrichota bacterium]
MKKLLLIFIGAAFLFGCAKKEESVTVYTHRHYEADKTIYKSFEEQTGIKVNIVTGSADELIKRLEDEGELSPADMLITVDAGRLQRAKNKNLLQSVESEVLTSSIPAHLRDTDNSWFGLTRRARVIVYAPDRVSPEDLSTYEALTGEDWKGRILIRSSQNIYNQSLLASMIAANGSDAAKSWAEGIVANMARTPSGNDRDQMKAVAAGIGDIAIVNTYYLGKLANSESADERAVAGKVKIFFPNQEDRGTHINVSGGAVVRHAKNRDNAVKLLEFMAGDEAQKLFGSANYEYPVKPGIAPSDLLNSWGTFKPDNQSINSLGELNSEAVKVFDEAGWR